MFDSEKSTGTQYTWTVALLAVAFIFIPAVLIVTRPAGSIALVIALLCSLTSATLAWVNWKKASQLSIPTIATQPVEPK